MLLEGSHFIHSPPTRVFALLNDPAVLARCVPGVKSLVLDGADNYKALVEVTIGPVKGKFDGKIAITEKLEPHSMTLKVEFKSPVGIANALGTLKLEPENEGTRVYWAGEPQLMGMIASVGARLIGGVAKNQADLFFSKLEQEAQVLESA
jgi:carbon monoxide dehydrogenase subunit G